MNGKSVIAATIVAVISTVVADDIKSYAPRLGAAIVRTATCLAPIDMRERLIEEWSADLASIPGSLPKILWAFDCIRAAIRVPSLSTGASRCDEMLRMVMSWPRAMQRHLAIGERWFRLRSTLAVATLIALMFATGAHRILARSVTNVVERRAYHEDWLVIGVGLLVLCQWYRAYNESLERDRRGLADN